MKEVFESHPGVDTIFVVQGMPFLKHGEALNFAGGKAEDVQTVTRSQVEAEAKVKAEAEAKAKAEAKK